MFRSTMKTMFLAVTIAIIYPSAADAQCPWCTSPTVCETIDDNAADSCQIEAGNFCENGDGICVVVETEEELAAMINAGSPTRTVDVTGQAVTLVGIGEALFAAWDCSGRLAMLFEEEEGGLSQVAVSELDRMFLALDTYMPRNRIVARTD